MSPCVLWIDEMEKGLATGPGDSGLSRRILGSFLTWMSEKKRSVFVVATANDISALPPELVRKGRFDEIFFVDLPDAKTRAKILHIHLKSRDLDVKKLRSCSINKGQQGLFRGRDRARRRIGHVCRDGAQAAGFNPACVGGIRANPPRCPWSWGRKFRLCGIGRWGGPWPLVDSRFSQQQGLNS